MSAEDTLFHTQRRQRLRKDVLNSIASMYGVRHSRTEDSNTPATTAATQPTPSPLHTGRIFQQCSPSFSLHSWSPRHSFLPSPNLAQMLQCYPRSTSKSNSICFWIDFVRHVLNRGFYSSPENLRLGFCWHFSIFQHWATSSCEPVNIPGSF